MTLITISRARQTPARAAATNVSPGRGEEGGDEAVDRDDPSDGPQFDAFTRELLRLAADWDWPQLAVDGRALVQGGREPWQRFVRGASGTEKALAVRVLHSRGRLNGRRAVRVWR
jgi:hypothetical protein